MNLFILGSPNYKVATRYNVLGTLSFSSVNMFFCCDVSVSSKKFLLHGIAWPGMAWAPETQF